MKRIVRSLFAHPPVFRTAILVAVEIAVLWVFTLWAAFHPDAVELGRWIDSVVNR